MLIFETNSKDIEKLLKNAPEQLKNKIKTEVNEVSENIANDARRLCTVGVSGELRRSIRVKHEGDDTLVGTDIKYAPYVEYGTKPHWTSAKNLIDWAMYKLKAGSGKKGEQKALSVAYAIVNKIAKEGTKPHPFLTPAIDKWLPMLVKRIDEIVGGW